MNGTAKRSRDEDVQDGMLHAKNPTRIRRNDSRLDVLEVKGSSSPLPSVTLGSALYSQAVHLKLWGVASRALEYVRKLR